MTRRPGTRPQPEWVKWSFYIHHDPLTDANECFAVLAPPQFDATMDRLKRSAGSWADLN